MTILDHFLDVMKDPASVFFTTVFLLVSIALVIKLSRPKPGKNPFIPTTWDSPRPLVTDPTERSKVIKQRFRTSRVPDNLDAVVIGSGIGGLSVAALLARAGKKVLVLEQHDQAGGCCHTFIDKGFEFDTGIHYVGQMKDETFFKVLMDYLTDGQLVWLPMDDYYDTVAIGQPDKARRYPHLAGNQRFWDNIKSKFPKQTRAIDAFKKIVSEISKTKHAWMVMKVFPKWLLRILIRTGIISKIFPVSCQYANQTLGETLDRLTDNAELKAVLSYAYGNLSCLAEDISLPVYCDLLSHYLQGAYYPLGGASEVAFSLIPVINRHGGEVLVDAPVTQILLDTAGRACGVTVTRNDRDITVMADLVVSDAGLSNTFRKLLPKNVSQKTALYHMVDKVGPSTASLLLFFGLAGTKDDLGLTSGNTWAFPSAALATDLANYMALPVQEAADSFSPMMFISFPSAKDPSWKDRYPGKSTCQVVVLVPSHWFDKWQDEPVQRRGPDYMELKAAFTQVLWHQIELLFPKLEGKLEYSEIGTPLSNRYYLGCPSGEIYGLRHSKVRVQPDVIMELRPKTDIPGLYLTGQDVATAGFVGALTGGLLCASDILHRNLFSDLQATLRDLRTEKLKRAK